MLSASFCKKGRIDTELTEILERNVCRMMPALCKRPKGRIDTEVKEFATNVIQGCDEDGDGALEWKEVKKCEVNKRHFLKKISTKISHVHQTLDFCAH